MWDLEKIMCDNSLNVYPKKEDKSLKKLFSLEVSFIFLLERI